MAAIAFPTMFNTNSTNVVFEKLETLLNLELLLVSEKGLLFGDPNFGTKLRQIFFELQATATQEIVADEISRAISTFMPQLRAPVNYIKFIVTGTSLSVELRVINIINYTSDIYSIELLKS